MVRILFIINSLNAGGAERIIMNLAQNIDRDFYEPILVCLHEKGVYYDLMENSGIKTVNLWLPYAIRFKELMDLSRKIKEFHPHIVQTFLGNPNRWGVLAAKLAGVPIIVTSVRNNYSYETLKQGIFDRFCFQFATYSVSCAESVKRFHVKSRWYPPQKINTIYSGIDIERFRLSSNKNLREELNLPAESLLIGTVASLTPQKGHQYLIAAAKEVVKVRRDVFFILVGEGGLREELENMVRQNNLEGYMKFTGLRKDIPEILPSFDLFVLPSLWEGLPVTIIEAMASGLPVVASNVDGVSEIVINGKTGVLVPPKNPEALSKAILELLDVPERQKEMGKLGRERVEKQFSIPAMVSKFDELYRTLLIKQKVERRGKL